MRLLFVCILLALPLICFAQTGNETNQCANCERFYVVTTNQVWTLEKDNKTLCMDGLASPRGLAIDSFGNVWLADEGTNIIWFMDKNCQNKKVVISNDGNTTSWLYPQSIALDEERKVLYVSNYKYDPLWHTWDTETRRLLAREKHVYALQLDANNLFTGTFAILASGVDNGKDITSIRFADGALFAIRKERYVSVLLGDWLDFIGPHNRFLIENLPISLKGLDSAFGRCGYMAAAADIENQFFFCNNISDISQCQSRCPDQLYANRLQNETKSDALLPFISKNSECLDVQEDFTAFDATSAARQLPHASCDNLKMPTSLVIDCACGLVVGSYDKKLSKFPFEQNQLGAGQNVMEFDQPIMIIDHFIDPQCSGATPEPTTIPEPTATPEPTSTPQPTSQPEPTATPEPTNTPQPTSTPQPTIAPSLFKRLRQLQFKI